MDSATVREPEPVMETELLQNGGFEVDVGNDSIAPWQVSWYKDRRGDSRAVRTRIGEQDEAGHGVELTRPPAVISLTQRVADLEKAAPGARLVASVSAIASVPEEFGLDIMYTSVTGERKRVSMVYHPGDGNWHRLTVDKYLPNSLVLDSISFRIFRRSRSDGAVLADKASLKLYRSDWSRTPHRPAPRGWWGIVLVALLLGGSWGWRVWQRACAARPTPIDGTAADTPGTGGLLRLFSNRRLYFWLKGPVAVLFLWVFAYYTFQSHPKSSLFRVDRNEAVAYPRSDARGDFKNALAILDGYGWVDWREHTRWSQYRPGWSAFLATVGYLTGRDPGRMQFLITLLLSGVGAFLYLGILALFPNRKMPIVAFVCALLFLMYPQCRSWWFQHSMMTGGPALLLAIALCTVGVRACSRRQWWWFEGLALGILMAAICMIRPQARYAMAAILAVVLVAAWPHFRVRIRFLLMLVCGFIGVIGPCYLKTSVHLGYPYTGISYTSVRGLLHMTASGRVAGGPFLEPDQARTEAQAISILHKRAKKALWINLKQPGRVLKEGLQHYHAYSLANVAKIFRTTVWSPTFTIVAWCLVALGVVFSVGRVGPAGTIPLIFSLAYLAPQVAMSAFMYDSYEERYGLPVSWIAIAYASGVLLWAIDPRSARMSLLRLCVARRRLIRGLRRLQHNLRARHLRRQRTVRHRPAFVHRPWHYWLPLLVLAVWLGGCTTGLVLFDLAPLPPNDVDTFLAHPRTQQLLAEANIEIDDDLYAELKVAFDGGGQEGRIRFGCALLPHTVEPDDPPFRDRNTVLEPRNETYTTFHFLVPWKMGGDCRHAQVDVRGKMYEEFRHGDQVVLILSEKDTWPHVEAVIPAH